MLTGEIMEPMVITVQEDDSIYEICDIFQEAHIHGAPVVDDDGRLVGIVSYKDVLFGTLFGDTKIGEQEKKDGDKSAPLVRDVMTAPAFSAREETPIEELCDTMWQLHVHHIPVTREDKLVGIVSSLDICRLVAEGDL